MPDSSQSGLQKRIPTTNQQLYTFIFGRHRFIIDHTTFGKLIQQCHIFAQIRVGNERTAAVRIEVGGEVLVLLQTLSNSPGNLIQMEKSQ